MTPATPRSPAYVSAPSTPYTPPGSWQHPKFDEICRRQADATFGDYSIIRISKNALALVASFLVLSFLSTNKTALSLASMFPATLLTYAGYAFWLARLVFVWNIGLELYKAVKPLDDFSDLDLTLDQRKLLGLPDTPVTASKEQEIFATPPRYSKTTPPSRTSSPLASASSPLASASSPLASTSSPTMQRKAALGSNRSDLGLSSLGIDTPSPLSTPLRNGLRPLFESPRSPKNVGGASSITPSHRWAYEKSILSKKTDPTSRLSPSKSIFSPR